MACGGGFYLQAIFGTLVILVALSALGWCETRFSLEPLVMTYEAVAEKPDELMSEINRGREQEHRGMDSVQSVTTDSVYLRHFGSHATRNGHIGRLIHLPGLSIWN